MYEGWEQYEPDSVRKALPLEWTVGTLFDTWGAGSEMISCPLPGHRDSTPSFNLWAEDEDGFPIRYGCFGCAQNGDVVDLIRLKTGAGFLEACRIAVEELIPAFQKSGWLPAEAPAAAPRAAASMEELESAFAKITTDPGSLCWFASRKGLIAEPLLDLPYIEEWGWRGFNGPAPTVAFPHRDWVGRLTGIRYRSVRRDGTRWTERGSRFPALYGAWRDKGAPNVILCEGETDTVWTAWQLRDLEHWDVLGLPAGAAQKPGPSAAVALKYRRVILAFDADMAGRVANARWKEFLAPVADSVLSVQLPEGEDMLSCGIGATSLIGAAA